MIEREQALCLGCLRVDIVLGTNVSPGHPTGKLFPRTPRPGKTATFQVQSRRWEDKGSNPNASSSKMSLKEVTTTFLLCGCGLNAPRGTEEQVLPRAALQPAELT